MPKGLRVFLLSTLLLSGSLASACVDPLNIPNALAYVLGKVLPLCTQDEAMKARAKNELTQNTEDVMMMGACGDQFKGPHCDDDFKDMDYGITKDPAQITEALKMFGEFGIKMDHDEAVRRLARGRINWIVWTAGNDKFWDFMNRATLGGLDFLKTISDHPDLPWARDAIKRGGGNSERWRLLGIINEPCYKRATGPRADRFGLWLPTRDPKCGPDPYENENKYPGVKIGSRGTSFIGDNRKEVPFPVGSIYGYSTGVIGLRLFPNPAFDQKAYDRWDATRYYKESEYYYDPTVIRPYRVGMSCAFCHVGPSPTNPPSNFEAPQWANLNSNPGAQYFWVDRIFDWDYEKSQDNFVVQLLKTSRPGTVDTSLVSSDMINNPRTMNAVYDLPSRVKVAMDLNHREVLNGGETLNAQFGTLKHDSVLSASGLSALSSGNTVLSPRVLKDGSDSVGALGALNRVFVNIGLYSEMWISKFIPLVGGPKIFPFEIEVARKNSIYWNATENQTPDLALFFLAATKPDKLAKVKNLPAGTLMAYNDKRMDRGKELFAKNCAQCHSSKLPEKAFTFFNKPGNPLACVGANYLKCWDEFWAYSRTKEFKDEMVKKVMQPDFLENNYLSTELRVPVNLVDSQLCSPVATNALKGDTWDNFASTSYKELPSIGAFTVNYINDANQVESRVEQVPGMGRGFFRPASLISLWSTAPFLQNNAVGNFRWEATTQARLDSFKDSITKMLNPRLRAEKMWPGQQAVHYKTSAYKDWKGVDIDKGGIVDVTTEDSYLKIPRVNVPDLIVSDIRTRLKQIDNKVHKIINKGKSWFKKHFGENSVTPEEMQAFNEEKKAKRKGFFSRVYAGIFGESEITEFASDEGLTANPSDDEDDTFIEIGPIPAGVPVNLISNLNLELLNRNNRDKKYDKEAFLNGLGALIKAVIEAKKGHTPNERRDIFLKIAARPLINASRCTDMVVNRGHYFGTEYSPDRSEAAFTPADQQSLIEFLKHM